MKPISLCCLLALTACTTPDVTPQIKTAGALLTTSTAAFRPALEKQAKAEVRAAENKLIAQNAVVYELEDCDVSDDFAVNANCRLVSSVDLSKGPVSASTSLLAFDAIDGYFGSLLAIASSESSDAVRLQSTALAAALKEAQAAKYEPLARLATRASKHADKSVAVAGFLANQYRVAQLRRLVRQADPAIEDILTIAAGYLDQKSGVSKRYEALVVAQGEVEFAQNAANPARYRRALDHLSKTHAAFIKAQRGSAGYSFRLLRKLHGDLLAQLNAPGQPNEILATVTEIRTVVDTLREKGT